MEYVDNIMFLGNWKVIFQTLKTVLKKEGINFNNSATLEKFMGSESKLVSSIDEVDV